MSKYRFCILFLVFFRQRKKYYFLSIRAYPGKSGIQTMAAENTRTTTYTIAALLLWDSFVWTFPSQNIEEIDIFASTVFTRLDIPRVSENIDANQWALYHIKWLFITHILIVRPAFKGHRLQRNMEVKTSELPQFLGGKQIYKSSQPTWLQELSLKTMLNQVFVYAKWIDFSIYKLILQFIFMRNGYLNKFDIFEYAKTIWNDWL